MLRPHEVGDARLDAGLADKVVDVDRAVLAEAVDATDPLLEDGRVPRTLDVDTGARGALQVQAPPPASVAAASRGVPCAVRREWPDQIRTTFTRSAWEANA
jgi:hypothetical protein